MSRPPAAPTLQPGDRVRRPGHEIIGIVRRLVPGKVHGTSYMQRIDRVAVAWADGELSLMAASRLERVEAPS